MKIGFTGTQEGMTIIQKAKVAQVLAHYSWRVMEVHHGCCIGADYQFHEICDWFDFKIVLHPPENQSKVHPLLDHLNRYNYEVRPSKPYLERNRDIVDEGVDLLIATPKEAEEVMRSGTWATIRYANKLKRETRVYAP